MVLLTRRHSFEFENEDRTVGVCAGVNFCGEAWYLRRRQVPHADFGERRLQQGAIAHRQIGMRTDHLRRVERLRAALLAATIVLLAVIAVQLGAHTP